MAIRENTEIFSEQYRNLLHCLELVGLDQADARNVCGRGIYSYNKPRKNFGQVVLDPLAAYFGFNPAYIRYGKGEPLLPNSAELVYLYMQMPDKNIYKNNTDNIDKNISDSLNKQTNQLLHREINFTKIDDLPEHYKEKIMKDIFPVKFVQIPRLDTLTKEQIDVLLANRKELELDAVKKINTTLDYLEIIRDEKYDKRNQTQEGTNTDND